MSDLFKEIDEAVRRDKAEKFWKENGVYFLGGAIALVLFTGIFTAWNGWTLKRNTAQTNLLVQAMSSPFPATALDAASGSLKGSHKAVARLHQASALLQDKKNEEALVILQHLRGDSSAPAVWRDLATLMETRLSFDTSTDAAQAKKLYDALQPLLNAGNPWQGPAQLQAAMIAADGRADYTAALKHLGVILNDKTMPVTLQERARALDHLYSLNAAVKKSQSKNEETTPKG